MFLPPRHLAVSAAPAATLLALLTACAGAQPPVVVTTAATPTPTARAEWRPDPTRPLALDTWVTKGSYNLVRVYGQPRAAKPQPRCFTVILDDANIPSNPPAIGRLINANPSTGEDPVWETSESAALLRGWFPIVQGPRVRIGADGSTLVFESVTEGGKVYERIWFADSQQRTERLTVAAINGWTVSNPPSIAPGEMGEFQAATAPNTLTWVPYSLAAGAPNPPTPAFNDFLARADALRNKARALGVNDGDACP